MVVTPTPVRLDDRFAPGTMLGRYELVATIGRGGMASVILARQKGPAGFEKFVVIKVAHPHMAQNRGAINMLLDEGRLAAQIDHPNVVHTYELGEAHGTFYIVMEYLAGESFFQVLKKVVRGEAELRPHLAARIVADACAGLHAAHELVDLDGHSRGLVHRDVSPGNIVILYSGAVKVVDFGVAKAHGRVTSTQDGELKGKYGYMAPEQIKNEPMDRRSDVFSLGVVLWEALTLRRLFHTDNVAATLMRVLYAPRVPPSAIRPEVPAVLDAVAQRALAIDPRDRFQSAAEMKQALDDAIWQSRCGASEIQAYMTTLFAARIEARRELLVNARARDLSRVIDLLGHTDDEATPGTDGDGDESSSAWLPPSADPVDAGPPATADAPEVFDSLISVTTQPRASTVALSRWQPPIGPPRSVSTRRSARIPILVLGVGALVAGVTAAIIGLGRAPDLATPVGDPTGAPAIAAGPPAVAIAPIERASAISPAPSTITPAPSTIIPAPAPPAELPVPPPPELAAAELAAPEPAPPSKARRPRSTPDAPAALDAPAAPAPPAMSTVTPEASPPSGASGASVAALMSRATELALGGDFPAAMDTYRQVLALDANHAAAHRGLGVVYQRIGWNRKAITSLETYLRLRPGATDATAIRTRIAKLEDSE